MKINKQLLLTSKEEINQYINDLPQSLAGDGGSAKTLSALSKLHSLLSHDDETLWVYAAMQYNKIKCVPQWNVTELEHKMTDCYKIGDVEKKSIKLKDAEPEKTQKSCTFKVNIKQFSAPELNLKGADATIIYLNTLFNTNEIINIGSFFIKEDGKKAMKQLSNYLVADFITALENGNITVDSYPEGLATAINPLLNLSSKRDTSNIADFRHMLLEMDRGTVEEQYNLIKSLGIPVSTLTHSGGAGLHAVVKVDAKNELEFDEYAIFLKSIMGSYGECVKDTTTFDAPRYSRLAGFMRGDNEQFLYDININTDIKFSDWKKDYENKLVEESFPFKYKHLDYFTANSVLETDTAIDLVENFITTEAVSILYGAAGGGKSLLATQLAMAWGAGLTIFGFKPMLPLKSIIFQWEDSDKKMQKLVTGIQRGMNLSESDMILASKNIIIPSRKELMSKSWLQLANIIELYIVKFRPHIIFLNPITAFFDGNMNDAETVKLFRDKVDYMAAEYNVHFCLVSHIPKNSKSRDTGSRFANVDMYDSFGSSLFTNWARHMFALQPSSRVNESAPTEKLFDIHVTKNGWELGWKDEDGGSSLLWPVAHSPNKNIYWVDKHGSKFITKSEHNNTKRELEKITNINTLLNILPVANDNGMGKSIYELMTQTKWTYKVIDKIIKENSNSIVKSGTIGLKALYSRREQLPVKQFELEDK